MFVVFCLCRKLVHVWPSQQHRTVMHIAFHASWCVHAHQWHLHFGFLCALHFFLLFFRCCFCCCWILHSFDTADNGCIVTVFKYLRHFDLISALFIFAFVGICCYFHWLYVFAVLYCAFKRKLHPTCQKNHTNKKQRRSSKPKGIGTIQAKHIVPLLIDFSCFIDFFFSPACWTPKNVCAQANSKDSHLSFCEWYSFFCKLFGYTFRCWFMVFALQTYL